MKIKNKIIILAACAFIAGIGIFTFKINHASAAIAAPASQNSNNTLNITQLQALVATLKQQIAVLMEALKQKNIAKNTEPRCGDGVCNGYEDDETCSDCITNGCEIACQEQGYKASDPNCNTADVGAKFTSGGKMCCCVKRIITKSCLKYGEGMFSPESTTRRCCTGLTLVNRGGLSVCGKCDNNGKNCGVKPNSAPASLANSIPIKADNPPTSEICGNHICGIQENGVNCPRDCFKNYCEIACQEQGYKDTNCSSSEIGEKFTDPAGKMCCCTAKVADENCLAENEGMFSLTSTTKKCCTGLTAKLNESKYYTCSK